MHKTEYKLVAPDIDRLLVFFDRGHLNPSGITQTIDEAMKPLFEVLAPLAPLKSNDEAKAIWLRIPRGDISDYTSFEDLKEYGEVETYQEYEQLWKDEYPEEIVWYRLVIIEGKNRNGDVDFKAVALGDKTIISAMMDKQGKETYSDDAVVALCGLLVSAAKNSMELLRKGEYNEIVAASLPYQFKTGVIKRSDLWKSESENKEYVYDGLSEDVVANFMNILKSGINDETKIARIKSFTANDFFKACAIGYKACGYDTESKSPSELYLKYADGRDEGLTGLGSGLNAGEGIDFDSPEEWDKWYFGNHGGGHPWEVVRGGNSTHLDLYVCNDRRDLDYLFRSGQIDQKTYNNQKEQSGYYFVIAGKHRQFEAVSFFTAIFDAALPVVLRDAESIIARFDGSDYVGIVPHSVIPKYCEEMFPAVYGRVIDFMHVYDEDIEQFGEDIIWIPGDEAELKE